ncbi:MAG: hypothetical protein NTW38_01375 [Candidatus Aminicenantes bacterium]|nr:hypothetical protein [Candidatus Aminicenantes bacterium]
MKKMLLVLLMMSMMLVSCDNLTTRPDPVFAYYTIQVFYTRPVITNWASVDETVGIILQGPSSAVVFLEVGADKYNLLVGEFEEPIADSEEYGFYTIYGLDCARLVGTQDDTAVVGDIFILRVKETGFQKRLTNIQNNTIEGNPYRGPNAKMALFRLMKDGTIQD